MFVSVILDSEYMGMGERIKWFIKNLSYARRKGWLIVTHEYLKVHFTELIQNCADRFYDEFEMERISETEMLDMNICFIPDDFFDQLKRRYFSRSKMIVELTNKNFPDLMGYVDEAISNELRKRPGEKVEGIFNCLHCFKSIVDLAEKYECPVIPYVFSALRKVHGYRQTLYMANMSADLMNNNEIKGLYADFQPEKFDFPLFSNKEILALLGKERNLPLLSLMDRPGIYELGVAAEGFRITPQSYDVNYVTDDDIYYEAFQHYEKNQVISRLHPMMLDQAGIGREHMKNDPAAFILSCKRVAAVQSQIIMKAALWKRTACIFSQALPYSFLFPDNLTEDRPLNQKDLNFIIFCYFIPDAYMFDETYWLWRMSGPSANEIFEKHLYLILKKLNYKQSIIYSADRLHDILDGRGYEDRSLTKLKGEDFPVDYAYLSSRLGLEYEDGRYRNIYCLNYKLDDCIISEFVLGEGVGIKKAVFWALDDVDGWVKLEKAEFDSGVISESIDEDYAYSPKGKPNFRFDAEYCNGQYLRIVWKAFDSENYLYKKCQRKE